MYQGRWDRDMTCSVIRCPDGVERAHLCPRSATGCFTREVLERHDKSASISGDTSIDDKAHTIALRQDVHTELDKGAFIFVREHGKRVSCRYCVLDVDLCLLLLHTPPFHAHRTEQSQASQRHRQIQCLHDGAIKPPENVSEFLASKVLS